MIEWYKKVVFENYANFSGRARRSEYWYFQLMNFIIIITLALAIIISIKLSSMVVSGIFFVGIAAYMLLTFLPRIAVIARRLHDIGKSGWFFFIAFVPFIGSIWLLVLLCTEGTQGTNDYGPDPKNDFDEINEIGTVEA